jgi:type I restriction enzyme M protein
VTQDVFDALHKANRELGLEAHADALAQFEFTGHSKLLDKRTVMRFLEREFRLAESFKIETAVNKDDLNGIGHWIRGAKKQADWLVYGVHCHESGATGEFHGGSRTSSPDFLVEFTHWAIDQGCDLFAGHGPHFMYCGSSGMFVQSVEFIRAHANGNGNGGKARADISIYGQESNYTTWRLARMNLAIRGIDGQIAHGDTFHNDRHPDLRADFILANPPFNVSDWRGELLRDDKRWQYGAPPAGKANFAWVQHIVHHLAPAGVAGFVLANGSMSSNQSGEGEIRKSMVEADLVDCMVALPGQLFYSTQIPACLWFLARDKQNGKFRDRRGHVLFLDSRKLGRMVDRTHRELTDEDIARIADTYHAWRGEKAAGEYADVPGFCKSATLEEIRKHGHVLTPGRYVGAEAQGDDGEPFEEKMQRLTATLREQQAEAAKLDVAIAANLKELGYGG